MVGKTELYALTTSQISPEMRQTQGPISITDCYMYAEVAFKRNE